MKITSETLQRAIEFAVEKHQGQVRKGDGRPYILHPMSVMLRIGQAKESTNPFLLASAAILHDTVEDCNVELSEIASKFGYDVAALVDELTLDKTQYTKNPGGKKVYLAEHMVEMSSYALAIKLADRLDNVSDLSKVTEDFRKKYIEETGYILNTISSSGRKLTKSHRKLIKLIWKELE